MIKKNPFRLEFDHEKDVALVKASLAEKNAALNDLIRQHNNFIYNIA